VIRSVVTDLAEDIDMPSSAVEDIQVAVSEACTNVVRHAYPPDMSDEEAELLIRCSADGGKITAEVIDHGCGLRQQRSGGNADDNGGFGLILIHTLMDQVQCMSSPDSGTRIRMVKFAARKNC